MLQSWDNCGRSLLWVMVSTIACAAVGGHGMIKAAGNTHGEPSMTGDPHTSGAPRWDLANAFRFDWESAELSARVVAHTDANMPVRTMTVTVNLAVLDFTGLVLVDVSGPEVYRVLDQDGQRLESQGVYSGEGRWCDHQNWIWDEGRTQLLVPLKPFNVVFRLPADPRWSLSSSISELEGSVYAVYADKVASVDIPFDPDYDWHEAPAIPDLLLKVDPKTPPCPGPLQYVKINPTGSRLDPSRPKTPVPLYKYQTWVKSKAGGPMLALRDASGSARSLYPLGKSAIVRTELFDSKSGNTDRFVTQWVMGDPFGHTGAQCFGEMEQGRNDAYDCIRHIIAINPVEAKIPFVLRNIPIPKER